MAVTTGIVLKYMPFTKTYMPQTPDYVPDNHAKDSVCIINTTASDNSGAKQPVYNITSRCGMLPALVIHNALQDCLSDLACCIAVLNFISITHYKKPYVLNYFCCYTISDVGIGSSCSNSFHTTSLMKKKLA